LVHLRKERFTQKIRSKLSPRVEGIFEIMERINGNAYRVELAGDYWVSATFNVANLRAY